MSTPRVLLIGGTGQIGAHILQEVTKTGWILWAPKHEELDITIRDLVIAKVTIYKPDVVINASGYTLVDQAESDVVTAFAINRDGVANIAYAAACIDAIFFHLSTDYVFSGKKSTAYHEDDIPHPLSVYGCSKLAGEKLVIQSVRRHLILRTSWVYGETGKNFVKTVLGLASEQKKLTVVCDQFGGPTYAGDVALTTVNMLRQALSSSFDGWGCYHYTGTPTINWYGFAQAIIKEAVSSGILESDVVVQPISAHDYPSIASRPQNSVLDCSLIRRQFDIEQCDWIASLRIFLSKVKCN